MKRLKPFTRLNLILLVCGMCLALISYLFGGWKELLVIAESSRQQETIVLDDIEKIHSETNMILVTGNVQKPTLTYYSNPHTNTSLITYQIINNQLFLSSQTSDRIQYDEFVDSILAFHKGKNSQSCQTVLTLPKNTHLKSITGTIQNGHIHMIDTTIDQLDLSIHSGDFFAQNTTIHSINLFNHNGNVDLKEVTLHDLDFSSTDNPNTIFVGNGEISATGLQVIGKYDMTFQNGGAHLIISKQSLKDLMIEASSQAGQVTSISPPNPHSANQLHVVGSSGNILIE